MKPHLLVLATLLFSLPAFAAEEQFTCAQKKTYTAEKGRDVLRRVQKRYAALGGLKADFTQRSFAAALEASEFSSGEASFAKPGQMRWHYREPDEQIFWVRDNTVWLYQIADKQAFVDNFSDILISDLPVAFLLGLGDLERDFALKAGCDSAEGIVLELTPAASMKKGKELQAFALLIDRQEYLPVGVKVQDVGGNQTLIWLKNLTLNPKFPETAFEVELPKGIDVIDRRKEQTPR